MAHTGKFEGQRLPSFRQHRQCSGNVRFQKDMKVFAAAKEAGEGVQVLANYVHGPGHITIVEPISSSDVVGMKLRVGGGVANDIGTALGVAGVNMPAPAVYESISSGVTEGSSSRSRPCMPSRLPRSRNTPIGTCRACTRLPLA